MEQRIARLSAKKSATESPFSDPPSLLILIWPILAAGSSFLRNDRLQSLFVAIAIVLVGVMVLVRLGRKHPARPSIQSTLLVISAFLAFVALSIFRAPAGVMEVTAKIVIVMRILLFFAFVFLAFLDAPPALFRKRFRALLLSLPLFLAVSLTLLPTMPREARANEAVNLAQLNTTLQFIGIQAPRLLNLPALRGASTIALLSGTAILALVYLASTSRTWRRLYWAMIVPNAVMLVLTDTRQVIVATVVCLGVYACRLPRAAWLARAALCLAVVSAPLLIFVQNLIDMSGVTDLMIRAGGGERFGALTGRDVIWNAAFSELAHPRIAHIIGYGQYGDLVARVSSSYAWMFYGVEGIASYHNAFLQYVLDSGYVTAALYFSSMWIAISAFSRGALGPSASRAVLALIALTLVGGFSEAIGTVRHFEHFTFLVGLMTVAVLLPATQARSATRPSGHQNGQTR